MTRMIAIPVSVPVQVAARLKELAPTHTELMNLMRSFVLEGLNRYELDCLWCRIKEHDHAGRDHTAKISGRVIPITGGGAKHG